MTMIGIHVVGVFQLPFACEIRIDTIRLNDAVPDICPLLFTEMDCSLHGTSTSRTSNCERVAFDARKMYVVKVVFLILVSNSICFMVA
jgi:hypothetical protein